MTRSHSVCTCGGGPVHLADEPALQVIDVQGASRVMDDAKGTLADLIADHMADRTERARGLRMTTVRFEITEAMVGVLEDLYRYGFTAALAEGRALGVLMSRPIFFDAAPAYPRLRRVVLALRTMLDTLELRTGRDLRLTLDDDPFGLDLSGVVRSTALRRLREYPGALDAASRVVSSSYTAGLDDVYAANEDLFGGWLYTSVLDGGTCTACRSRNGEVYATYAEAMIAMPGFGPNPDCFGRGRCRCRLAALPPED